MRKIIEEHNAVKSLICAIDQVLSLELHLLKPSVSTQGSGVTTLKH